MVNFVDTILNTSATGGVVKYTLTHADSTTEQVQIDLATPIQTQGTALNKVTFDSIQTDLTTLDTNKLNKSSKTTQAQAEAGTDNTNYMTALRTQQKLNSMRKKFSNSTTSSLAFTTDTILDVTTLTDKTFLMSGKFNNSNECQIVFNYANSTNDTLSITRSGLAGFEFLIDTSSNVIIGKYQTGSSSDGLVQFVHALTTQQQSISSIQTKIKGSSTSYSLSVQQFS